MTRPQLRALRAAALAVLELWEENRRDPTAASALDTRMKVDAGPRWHAVLRHALEGTPRRLGLDELIDPDRRFSRVK